MQTITESFKLQQQIIYQDFKTHHSPYRFFKRYSETVDQILKQIWYLYLHDSDERLCLIATGGTGRGELYPYSDTDLAIITKYHLTTGEEQAISNFVNTLWDIGLSPSVTMGTVTELFTDAKNHISKETSFLETRYILGNQKLASALLVKLENNRDIVDFMQAKLSELEVRHNSFKGATKHLEPDVKNSPGGLRDIHTFLWITQAQGLKTDIIELTQSHIITMDEGNLIINSHQNLALIRIHLHMLTGKNENHLLFNYQNDIAKLMHCHFPEDPRKNTEQLMQIFYRATKLVRQLMGILIPMLERRVSSPYPRKIFQIDKNYYQVGNLIACNDVDIFTKDPKQILQIITYLQTNVSIIGMAPETLRAWWSAVQGLDTSFAENFSHQQLFIGLFKHEQKIFEILQYLNLYGFLEKYLPDFAKVVGLLQNDLFHIYPVDDHTLTVIYYMIRLENENFAFETPFASNLMSNYKHKYQLYLAAFFHDIGKGRGSKHEIIGAQIARQFCNKHHLNREDTNLIVWLVKNHLNMSITAQKKDLGDYLAIKEFAELVQTPERLVALYLLTISDIRGTNPAIWNNWKNDIIYQLFILTLRVLQDKHQLPLKNIVQKSTVIKQIITEDSLNTEKVNDFANKIDDSFFNTQTLDTIRWQLKQISQSKQQSFFSLKLLDNNTMACIVFKPKHIDLMLILCKVFAHLYLNIIQARAFTTKDNWVLNKFIVAFPCQYLSQDIQRITYQLEYYLDLVLEEIILAKNLSIPAAFLTRRSLHSNIIPKVTISQENYQHSTEDHFMISLVTINQNALLANVVALFNQHHIEIISISINTLGERVEDSFLVKSHYLTLSKNRTQFTNQLLAICSL